MKLLLNNKASNIFRLEDLKKVKTSSDMSQVNPRTYILIVIL